MLEALVGPSRSETYCEFHNWALTCFDTNSFLGQVRCCLLHGRFVKFICHNSERCLLPQPYISTEQLRGFSGSRKHINFHPPISRHWMFRISRWIKPMRHHATVQWYNNSLQGSLQRSSINPSMQRSTATLAGSADELREFKAHFTRFSDRYQKPVGTSKYRDLVWIRGWLRERARQTGIDRV